jgi:predicted ABC-type sugar transport system permease subunit
MVKNMGIEDRVIRVLLAIVVGILFLTGTISGTVGVILGIVAVVFLVTSAIGFCPGYVPLKINTARKG